MLNYVYATLKPPVYWKVQITSANMQEACDLLAALGGSNAAIVDGAIEWSYGMMPVHSFRAGVGDWISLNQPYPPQAITEISASTSEPLVSGYQTLTSQTSSFTITAD